MGHNVGYMSRTQNGIIKLVQTLTWYCIYTLLAPVFIMKVKIILKNYGKGKKRIILINEDGGNIAFTSFGEKDKEYIYLIEQFKKQENECK